MKRFTLLVPAVTAASLVLACACAKTTGTTPAKAPEAKTPAPSAGAAATTMRLDPKTVIATWDGGQITYGELHQKHEATFKKLENNFLRDLYSTEQQELEGVIIETLVKKAAARAGKSEDELVKGLAGEPTVTDQEIAAYYEKNLKASGQPLDALKERIRTFLAQGKQRETMRAAFEKLKADAKVKVDLPAPPSAVAKFELEGRPMRGSPNAKVSIVEFSDFQCPYCGKAVASVESLLAAYPNDVKLYFLNFPLSFHESAMPAAIAAMCAHKQGKFWPFYERVFANQHDLSKDLLDKTAKDVGLDEGQYQSCTADPATKQMITHDMEQGEAAGVEGTPSFFINGVLFAQGIPTPEAIRPYLAGAN